MEVAETVIVSLYLHRSEFEKFQLSKEVVTYGSIFG